ncbi:Nucleoside H+ symporter [Nesidiocoris tenuis]|uniref:Nucleoside H+ symporter n=1 Tax=Nesidiocoris tenuis TaxID=355587 RepID=A0ABN7B4J4_9HEMI|nr:Nucleoside H+ symporter [Nesidiocoris tenuis]
MRIDKKMLNMKLHYFLFNAGAACMIPFLPVMAKSMGYSSVIVGIIYTFLPVMGMITKPVLGALADKFRIQKLLCIYVLVQTMVFLFAIPWIPGLPSQSVGEVHCDSDTVLKLTSTQLDKCLGPTLNAFGENGTIKCEMRCSPDANMTQEICKDWHQTQYCSQLKSAESSHFSAMALKSANLSAQTPKPAVRFATMAQNITFEGILQPYKSELINSSLYMRLKEVVFNNGAPVSPYCDSFSKMNCELVDCSDPLIDDLFLNPAVPDSETPHLYQFWLFVLFIVLGWTGQAGGVSLGDTICFELLGDEPSKYGDQRLWGSVGWGTFSVIAGIAVDHFSDGRVKNYLPAAVMLVVLFIMNIVVIARLKYEQTKISSSILRDVGRLLAELRVLVFLLWCIVIGMCTALVWNFLLWYLEDLAAAYSCDTKAWIKTLEGLVMAVQCFGGELPFFFLSGRILKKLGHVNCMTLVLAASGVRFILYSFLVNPWWCLPIEIMNGVTFGLCYAAMTSYASIVALPGTESTMQGLVGAIFEGVGVSLGSFIGGILFNSLGGAKAFQIFGIGALCASVVHAVIQYFLGMRFSVVQFHERDFKHKRYASPHDAIHMLQDAHYEPPNVPT